MEVPLDCQKETEFLPSWRTSFSDESAAFLELATPHLGAQRKGLGKIGLKTKTIPRYGREVPMEGI